MKQKLLQIAKDFMKKCHVLNAVHALEGGIMEMDSLLTDFAQEPEVKKLLFENSVMDLNYLVNDILPVREQEIKDGKNYSTRQPIYVVLDMVDCYCSGHSDYSPSTNNKGIGWDFGYIDMYLDCESREFSETDEGMKEPEEVTRFYVDRIVAFFLTSEAAHDYLKYQSHNLSKNAYVYVFYSGYRNHQMDNLLKQ